MEYLSFAFFIFCNLLIGVYRIDYTDIYIGVNNYGYQAVIPYDMIGIIQLFLNYVAMFISHKFPIADSKFYILQSIILGTILCAIYILPWKIYKLRNKKKQINIVDSDTNHDEEMSKFIRDRAIEGLSSGILIAEGIFLFIFIIYLNIY